MTTGMNVRRRKVKLVREGNPQGGQSKKTEDQRTSKKPHTKDADQSTGHDSKWRSSGRPEA